MPETQNIPSANRTSASLFVAEVNKEIGVVWDGLPVKVWNDAIRAVYYRMLCGWPPVEDEAR